MTCPLPHCYPFLSPPEIVKGLVSGLFSVELSVSAFVEYNYEESLKLSLMLALANVMYLGSEADFAVASLRAFVLDNTDIVTRVLDFAEGYVEAEDTGLAVIRRLLAFYS